MKSNTDNFEQTIDQLNQWPIVLMMGLMVVAIIIMQEVWRTIEGLYFYGAYEATVIPLVSYGVYQLYLASDRKAVNKLKLGVLAIAFVCLFLPAAYLIVTGQIDIHGAIFSEFTPELKHMPGAKYLPFVFLAVLVAPIKKTQNV